MKKHIALIAHDGRKKELLAWVKRNQGVLEAHTLYATGTTGAMVESQLSVPVEKLLSGPLGGDQQIGARIAEGKIDCLVFFWDPLSAHPHDADINALLRMATLWNVPTAYNEATGDILIASALLTGIFLNSETGARKCMGSE